ncbi:MAG TPA: GerAB/ArcD/ProY family transporter [Candidatus Acidoferrum sp.]|nr:GerAB/ArcD/ProY family transporter [Candidatus Acidoferrum sp.]
MKKGEISARNVGCVIALASLATTLIAGFSGIAQDIWLAVPLSLLLGLPLMLMYARIAALNPGLGLYDIISMRTGPFWRKVFYLAFIWYALHVTALVTRNFAEFVVTISLERTPKVFVIMGIIAVAGYLSGENDNLLGRWAIIAVSVIMVNLFVTIALSIPAISFDNLKPVMEHGFNEIFSAAATMGAISYAETVLILISFDSLKQGDTPYKAYAVGALLGTGLLFVALTRNVLVLGREMTGVSLFPSYITARVINPGTFVEHIESLIAFNLIVLGITKAAVCLRVAAVGAAKLFKKKEGPPSLMVPACLVSTALSVTVFSNMFELVDFVEAYRFYVIPFTVVIPGVLWLKSEVAHRKNKKGTSRVTLVRR